MADTQKLTRFPGDLIQSSIFSRLNPSELLNLCISGAIPYELCSDQIFLENYLDFSYPQYKRLYQDYREPNLGPDTQFHSLIGLELLIQIHNKVLVGELVTPDSYTLFGTNRLHRQAGRQGDFELYKYYMSSLGDLSGPGNFNFIMGLLEGDKFLQNSPGLDSGLIQMYMTSENLKLFNLEKFGAIPFDSTQQNNIESLQAAKVELGLSSEKETKFLTDNDVPHSGSFYKRALLFQQALRCKINITSEEAYQLEYILSGLIVGQHFEKVNRIIQNIKQSNPTFVLISGFTNSLIRSCLTIFYSFNDNLEIGKVLAYLRTPLFLSIISDPHLIENKIYYEMRNSGDRKYLKSFLKTHRDMYSPINSLENFSTIFTFLSLPREINETIEYSLGIFINRILLRPELVLDLIVVSYLIENYPDVTPPIIKAVLIDIIMNLSDTKLISELYSAVLRINLPLANPEYSGLALAFQEKL